MTSKKYLSSIHDSRRALQAEVESARTRVESLEAELKSAKDKLSKAEGKLSKVMTELRQEEARYHASKA